MVHRSQKYEQAALKRAEQTAPTASRSFTFYFRKRIQERWSTQHQQAQRSWNVFIYFGYKPEALNQFRSVYSEFKTDRAYGEQNSDFWLLTSARRAR